MSHPSDDKLAAALGQAGLGELARRALFGEFNDYFSERHVAPKMALVAELRAAGQDVLAQRVIRGEFDSGRDEAEEWYRSSEGQAMRDLIEEP